MKFTDRFLELPCKVYDIKLKDQGVEQLEDSFVKLLPLEIAEYRPSYADEDSEQDTTVIILKNGSTTNVYLTIEEFEHKVNRFMDGIK